MADPEINDWEEIDDWEEIPVDDAAPVESASLANRIDPGTTATVAPTPRAAAASLTSDPLRTFGEHVMHGGSFGRSDEAMGYGYGLAETMGEPPIPRATRGIAGKPTGAQDWQAGTQGRRDELARMAERDPTAAMLGTAVGAGAVSAPFSIYAAPTTTAALLTEGAVVSGMLGSGESEATTPTGVATDTAEAVAVGAPLNAIIPGAAAAGGRALEAMGKSLGKSASARRLGGWGAYGSDVADLMRSKGPQAVENIARRGESLGLGGVKSWQETERVAVPVVERVGARIGELNDAATSSGVRVNMGKVADALDAQAAELRSTSRLPEMQSEAAELQAQADALRATRVISKEQAATQADRIMNDAVAQSNKIVDAARGASPQMQSVAIRQAQELFADAEAKAAQVQRSAEFPDEVPFATAHKIRQWLDGKVWDNTKASFSKPDAGVKARLYRDMASKTRVAIGEGLDAGGASDVRAALREANADYEAASFALDAAAKRTAREGGNQALSMQTVITAPISGTMGFMGSGGDPGATALATMGSALATEGVKRYGNATAATAMRGMERAALRTAAPMQPATRAVTSSVRRGVAADVGAASGARSPGGMSMDPAAVLATIDDNPDAFGPYTGAMRAAALQGDQRAMALTMMAAQRGQ